MHATVDGATAETGSAKGMSMTLLPPTTRFYSGDVHTPRVVGNVTYVGCPHPVHFGDGFSCRMLLLDKQTLDVAGQIDLSPPHKLMLGHQVGRPTGQDQTTRGDQVKIRFHGLPAQGYPVWQG